MAIDATRLGEPTADLAAEVTREADPEQWSAAYNVVFRALVAMGASPEDAADAIQDAYERALRQRPRVQNAEAWLFVVAKRAWSRHRWRQRIFHPLEALRRHGAEHTSDTSIDLLTELQRLTERQRDVLVARYVLGLSQRETGLMLGISPGTVASTAHRAHQKLRERLGGHR